MVRHKRKGKIKKILKHVDLTEDQLRFISNAADRVIGPELTPIVVDYLRSKYLPMNKIFSPKTRKIELSWKCLDCGNTPIQGRHTSCPICKKPREAGQKMFGLDNSCYDVNGRNTARSVRLDQNNQHLCNLTNRKKANQEQQQKQQRKYQKDSSSNTNARNSSAQIQHLSNARQKNNAYLVRKDYNNCLQTSLMKKVFKSACLVSV